MVMTSMQAYAWQALKSIMYAVHPVRDCTDFLHS
jgi:hypothetical protein